MRWFMQRVCPHRILNQFGWKTARLFVVCSIITLPVRADQGGVDSGRKVRGRGSVAEVAPLAFRSSHVEHFQQWVQASVDALQQVRDYECTFVKQERIGGQLQDEYVAVMRVRSNPFSVYLKFTAPRTAQGREVSYVAGRHQGKMRAKNGGALGVLGFVLIDPQDPRAMQGTRHAITEAGIANLVSQLQAACETIKASSQPPTIRVAETAEANQPFVVFELLDTQVTKPDQVARTIIVFDRNTNLPIRYRAYLASGQLWEGFSYHSIRFNVGLTDAAFP